MADSTVRAGQDDEPEISCSTRKYGDSPKLDARYFKRTQRMLEEASIGKIWAILRMKINNFRKRF